jgi:hypothetical protein
MSNLFFSANGEIMEQPGQPGNIVENMGHEDGHEDLPYAYEDDDHERFANDDEEHERFANDDEEHERFANDDDDHERFANDDDDHERFANDDDDHERFANDDEEHERFTNNDDDYTPLVENMSNDDHFDLKGNLNLSGGIKAKDFSTPDGKSLLKLLDQKNTAFNSRLNINSGKDHIGLNVQSDTDSHIQLKTKNDDNKNVYLINRDGHFRVHQHGVGDMFGVNKDGHTYINSGNNHIGLNVQSNADSHIQLKTKNDDGKNVYLINRDGHFRLHHHGVGDMFGVNKDGHTYINSGNNWLGLNVQSNTDSHILLRTKNDAKKDLYLINRDGHFRLHQGGVGDMFGVNKDGHHYVRHTGDHVAHLEGDGNNPYITLGKTGTWDKKKFYVQNVNAHTDNPTLRIATHGGFHHMDMDKSHGVRWQRKDGRWTHLDWENGMNYIRGNTQHDNTLFVGGDVAFNGGNNWVLHTPDDNRRTMYVAPSKGYNNQDWNWGAATELRADGSIAVKNAIHLEQNIPHPDVGDGTIYRADGQVQIATDDLIRLRHVGSKQTGIQFDTRPGHGDIHVPNGEMKISRGGIMFGGPNKDREHNSAQISAGQHVANSLNIVGMSSGKGHQDRRVDMWAEGGMHLHGGLQANQGAWNGWISGNFGAHEKDRVVMGNLENQATVGSHNNKMDAWAPLTLRGNTINLTSHGGIVNYPNNWRINTSDGHFRIQHGGADKFVVHNAGHPAYTPNGLDIGGWWGTGNGTLNVAGNVRSRHQDVVTMNTPIKLQTSDNGHHNGAWMHTHGDGVMRVAAPQHRTTYFVRPNA